MLKAMCDDQCAIAELVSNTIGTTTLRCTMSGIVQSAVRSVFNSTASNLCEQCASRNAGPHWIPLPQLTAGAYRAAQCSIWQAGECVMLSDPLDRECGA